MTPAWLRLLQEWNRRGRFGLTIPFIYGALDGSQRLLGNGDAQEKLRHLIDSIADDIPDGAMVRLFHCGTVGDLTLAEVRYPPDFCRAIEARYSKGTSFYVTSDLFPDRGTIAPRPALHGVLWHRYGAVLERGHFSLSNGEFSEFSEKERAFIDAAMSRPDEAFE